jgi:glycine betaine/proline transport system substrate-binding protein
MNAKIQKAIDMNAGGLGDWTLVPSSTAIMLAQVKRRTDKHQWVAWGAWSPHWMMSAFNTHFLKNATKASLGNKVVIKTVVPKGFKKQHPNVARFLMQFHVSSSTQSQWIYKYKFANIPMDGLVSNWIKSHRKEVSKWLAGVRTRDGQQAVKVIRQP